MKNVLFIKQFFPEIVKAAMFVIHVITSKVGRSPCVTAKINVKN